MRNEESNESLLRSLICLAYECLTYTQISERVVTEISMYANRYPFHLGELETLASQCKYHLTLARMIEQQSRSQALMLISRMSVEDHPC
jgi:hypothetical protein